MRWKYVPRASTESHYTTRSFYFLLCIFIFPFSCLLGGFWSHQRLRRKTSQQHRNTRHFFCQDPMDLWQLQLQNKLFTEHIFLSDLRRRHTNLKVAYRGPEEVKLDHLPHMIQQSFTMRSVSCYLQPFIMKLSKSTSPWMIWRWLSVTKKR